MDPPTARAALTIDLQTPIIRGSLNPDGDQAVRRQHPRNGIQAVANIKSAKKRARQQEKTRLHNMGLRSKLRTHIKNVVKAVEKGDKAAATEAYTAAVPIIDSMINKGIVNRNKAARHKSRLNKMVQNLAA
jgi:small subunit ribosomal protein S20